LAPRISAIFLFLLYMLRACSLLILILVRQFAWCQTTSVVPLTSSPESFNVGFFIGTAIPNGTFASKNYSDSAAGFAKTGVIAGLTASYTLNDKLGLTAQAGAFANNVDEASLAKQINQKYPGYTWTVMSDNWRANFFLAGLTLKLPLQAAELDLSGLLGGASVSSPETFLTGSKGSFSNTAKVSGATTGAFCFMLAATIKKELSPKICFLFTGGFLHTRPQFVNVNTSFTSGAGTTSNFYQDISIFNISAGLLYRLAKN
jgi:hypothetical protein